MKRPRSSFGGEPGADERRRRLNEQLRAAFIAGAEEQSRRALGRSLTRDELDRVPRRYPGDIES